MKLYALSDLHLNHAANRATIESLPAHPDDWLILAGDLGEKEDHLHWAFRTLVPKWSQVIWVPGNHELWTPPSEEPHGLRGVARYASMVTLCQSYGVVTPEDPYIPWSGEGADWICPLFLLYDYSFGPPGLTPAQTVQWAHAHRVYAADETLLHPDPFPSRQAWCAHRLKTTAKRLSALSGRTVLINHWPLRLDLTRIPAVPRYIPWCGTRQTNDWHTRFNAAVVVSGHLHVRATDWRDGTRFEEVSLGYPRHWDPARGASSYLRAILPSDAVPSGRPTWHR